VDVIPEALVEETWREMESWSDDDIRQLIKRITKTQGYLFVFVMESLKDLSVGAQELALYVFAMIQRMFWKAAGRVRRARPREIEAAYERNEEFLGRFVNAHERFLERAAKSMDNPQPFVMKYLVEALMEAPTGKDPVALSEDETGEIFLILKTAIEVLEKVSQPSREPRGSTETAG